MKTQPIRIRLSRRAGFDLQAASRAINGLAAVNCARPSVFGNPFIVGENGDRKQCVGMFKKLLAGLVCLSQGDACYHRQKVFLNEMSEDDKAALKSLRGKNLACWCELGKPCHADVLLEIANS